MQVPTIDPLTNFEKEAIRRDFRSVIDDSDHRVSITYERQTSSSVDLETGVVTETEDSDAIQAVRTFVTVEEVEASGGKVQVGDRKYLIDQADLTTTPATMEDTITEGSDTLQVVDWREDRFGFFYELTARLA